MYNGVTVSQPHYKYDNCQTIYYHIRLKLLEKKMEKNSCFISHDRISYWKDRSNCNLCGCHLQMINNKDIYGVTIVSKFRHGSSHFEKGKKGVTMKLDVTMKCNCNKKIKGAGGPTPGYPSWIHQSI